MPVANGSKTSSLDVGVVTETALSEVDGERGRLTMRGFDLEELAGKVGFEDVAGLLWNGSLPDANGRENLRRAIARGRVLAFERLGALGDALSLPDAMEGLRAATGHIASGGSEEGSRLTGAIAVFAAAWARKSAGLDPIAPDVSLTHSADYARMMLGTAPSAAADRALATYLVTIADHGMNASTFAARVVASTGSDAVSAIVAGIGALKGPLHGGAPGPVLDMLDAVGSSERAKAWIEAELGAGRRIMGMGHRIYRVRDPRAAVLERAIVELERDLSSASSDSVTRRDLRSASDKLSLARAVETAAEQVLAARYPERTLRANVEFYTAVLLDAVGIPRQMFSSTFAVGRVVGWYAHVTEQRAHGRLIRPASHYVGPRA
jgi:citrate synthase